MKFNFNAFISNILAAFLIAVCVGYSTSINPVSVGLVVFSLGCILPPVLAGSKNASVAYLGIQRTLWTTDIAANIYPDNSFMMQSRDDGMFLSGHTVKLNQSGVGPNVKKNRTQLPATATRANDTTADYTIDEYTTDPIIITNTEEIEANYPMRQNILFDHTEKLKTSVAEGMLFAWTPEKLGVNVIRTSGASRDPFKIFQLGASKVQRKRISFDDVTRAAAILNSQDVPLDGRYALIDAELVPDLLKIPEFTSLEKIGRAVIVDGAIGTLCGFQFFVRSSAALYSEADGEKIDVASGEVLTSNDNVGTLFWQKNFVRRCFGGKQNGIDVFSDSGDDGNGNPLYYGTILSAKVRSGGRIARADEKGVVLLVESHA
jgi:N4-gp56 family major capsid protein